MWEAAATKLWRSIRHSHVAFDEEMRKPTRTADECQPRNARENQAHEIFQVDFCILPASYNSGWVAASAVMLPDIVLAQQQERAWPEGCLVYSKLE